MIKNHVLTKTISGKSLPEMTDKMAAAAGRCIGTGYLKMAGALQEYVWSSKLNCKIKIP